MGLACHKAWGHRVVVVPEATSALGQAIVWALSKKRYHPPVVILAGVPPLEAKEAEHAEVRKALKKLSRVYLVMVDIHDDRSVQSLFTQAHTVLLAPSLTMNLTRTRELVDLAHSQRVPHLVLLSHMVAHCPLVELNPNDATNVVRINPWIALESHVETLRPTWATWTIVRLPFILEWLFLFTYPLRLSKTLSVATGLEHTRIPVLSMDEIAMAVATVLLAPELHAGFVYNLTHLSSIITLSSFLIAASAAWSTELTLKSVAMLDWIQTLRMANIAPWICDLVPTLVSDERRDGHRDVFECDSATTCHFETILGRPPQPLCLWLTRHNTDLHCGRLPTRIFVIGLNEQLGMNIAQTLVGFPGMHVCGCDNVLGIHPQEMRPVQTAATATSSSVRWVTLPLQNTKAMVKAWKRIDVVLWLPSR
jgi:hypothetical protein